MQHAVWLLVVVILPEVLGLGTGPPTTQHPTLCETMLPGHGTTTATGTVPFAIEVTTNQYKKAESIEEILLGSKLTVRAKDTDKFFRGFFLQARRGDGLTPTAIGSFISEPEDGTQFIQCGTVNSAWGHADRLKKTSVTATWMGPSSDIGILIFNATVVGNNKQEYWTSVVSSDITFASANGVKSQSYVLSMMAVLAYVMRK